MSEKPGMEAGGVAESVKHLEFAENRHIMRIELKVVARAREVTLCCLIGMRVMI